MKLFHSFNFPGNDSTFNCRSLTTYFCHFIHHTLDSGSSKNNILKYKPCRTTHPSYYGIPSGILKTTHTNALQYSKCNTKTCAYHTHSGNTELQPNYLFSSENTAPKQFVFKVLPPKVLHSN